MGYLDPDGEAPAGIPRWVKVFGIVVLAILVLVVGMLLTGHGPGRHLSSAERGPSPLASVTEPGRSTR
jgi:hypothetical protein